ncbi:MAG: hypothetical protein H7Y02_03920 [Candidatus Obscuribacterales bacterium]|nr:hypothetical protein [Steroidobacteraceae bacterium]
MLNFPNGKSTTTLLLPCLLCIAMALGLMSATVAAAETWDGGAGSADSACRAKIDGSGAYAYSRVEVKGDVGHCYVKIKEGKGDDIYETAVTRDAPPDPEQQSAAESNATANTPAANDKKPASTDAEEICAEKYKKITECYIYEGRKLTHKSYDSARSVLVNKNKGKKLDPEEATAEKCDNEGKHWNFYVKGIFRGSVLGCECCRNTNSKPVMENRFGAFPE